MSLRITLKFFCLFPCSKLHLKVEHVEVFAQRKGLKKYLCEEVLWKRIYKKFAPRLYLVLEKKQNNITTKYTIVFIYANYWLPYSILLSFTFRPDLMVKKLRYYARFIVVCLLLKKMKLVRDLVRELSKHIDEYTATYEPEDQLEWSLVLGEIKAFIEADTIVNVLDSDSNSIVLSHR